MAKIIHSLGNLSISKDSSAADGFMLTNKTGGFLFFSEYPVSKYNGFFIREKGQAYKIVEDIRIKGMPKLDEIRNNFHEIQAKKGEALQTFSLPHGFNTMICELDKAYELEISLDCKKIYDNREFGRYYEIKHEQGRIVVEFQKKDDSREAKDKDNGEYSLFVVIDCDSPHKEKNGEWQHWFYHLDFERKSPPYERFSYAIKPLVTKRLVITAGTERQRAIDENIHVCHYITELKERQRKYALSFLNDPLIKELSDKNRKMSYLCARFSSDGLIVADNSGSKPHDFGHVNFHKGDYYAGLPWFTQFWARDSLVAASACTDPYFLKDLLMHYLDRIGNDGRIPNREPPTGIGCADGVGWLFLRIRDAKAKGIFDEKELVMIRKRLSEAIIRLYDTYSLKGFIKNDVQETWMDTIFNDEGRPGKRIEIQCLVLNMLRLYAELSKDTRARVVEKEMQLDIKEEFFRNGMLLDGIYMDEEADEAIRPNVFLAYYAYPKLLSKQEWVQCFDACLNKLWLPWGGLSSIAKDNPLFQPLHTGDNAMSYHRGDSWYWANNIAALAMADLDIVKYKKYVEQLREASINDLLWNGVVGHSSELSSAMQQKSEGCLNQAWSSSTLVELMSKTRILKSPQSIPQQAVSATAKAALMTGKAAVAVTGKAAAATGKAASATGKAVSTTAGKAVSATGKAAVAMTSKAAAATGKAASATAKAVSVTAGKAVLVPGKALTMTQKIVSSGKSRVESILSKKFAKK